MNRYFSLFVILLLTLATQANAGRLDEIQSVVKANEKFYAALNEMFKGDSSAMKDIWSHRSDATYMGPDGSYLIGWDAIREDWAKQAGMKLGGEVKYTEARVIFTDPMAVVQCYEIGHNFDNEGNKVEVKIRATNVFIKIGQDWKMVSHHTDLLPHLMPQP